VKLQEEWLPKIQSHGNNFRTPKEIFVLWELKTLPTNQDKEEQANQTNHAADKAADEINFFSCVHNL